MEDFEKKGNKENHQKKGPIFFFSLKFTRVVKR